MYQVVQNAAFHTMSSNFKTHFILSQAIVCVALYWPLSLAVILQGLRTGEKFLPNHWFCLGRTSGQTPGTQLPWARRRAGCSCSLRWESSMKLTSIFIPLLPSPAFWKLYFSDINNVGEH